MGRVHGELMFNNCVENMNKLIFLGFFLVVFAGLAESWCCGCKHGYPCAATGGCNIFCCNCAGSCQKGRICPKSYFPDYITGERRRKRSTEFVAFDIVIAADDDGNKILDYEEASQYLHHRKKRNAASLENIDWFSSLDTNLDGFLTAEEIDPHNQSQSEM